MLLYYNNIFINLRELRTNFEPVGKLAILNGVDKSKFFLFS